MKSKVKTKFKNAKKRIFAGLISISVMITNITPGIIVNAAETSSIFTDYQPTITETIDNSGFKHPGVGLTKDILENIRTQVRSQKEPWYSYYNAMTQSLTASKTVTSSNQSSTDPRKPAVDAFDSQSFNSKFIADGLKAYTQAIMYYITGDEVYRSNAMGIIRIWSQMNPSKYLYFTDAHIHTGIPLNRMVTAAEILRYTSCKTDSLAWTEKDTTDFTNNLINPVIETFQHTNSKFMNQHLYPLLGAISGYIFTGNKARYEEGVEWFTINKAAVDQGQNGSIKQLFRLVDTNILTGEKVEPPVVQQVEMGRDQAHGAGDITNVEILARLLLAQGTKVDPVEGTVSASGNAVGPYEFLDNRILKATDYFSRFMMGYDTPWTPVAAHTDANGNPTVIYKELSKQYWGRIGGNVYDAYYYYKYNAGIDIEKEAPYFSEMFDKRLPFNWDSPDGGGDYWFYIPKEAEVEGAKTLPKAITDPYREIEHRYTRITGDVAAIKEADTSYVRLKATETGSKIALVASNTSSKTIGFKIRTNGVAKMDMTYGIDDTLTLPDTKGEWKYVTYSMSNFQGLGDMFYITVKGTGTIVDIDHINISAGNLLTPPVFKAGNKDLSIFACKGAEATINYDFSATDSNTAHVITYQIDNKPEGAVFDQNTGAFSWKPTKAGTYSFVVAASDGTSVNAKDVKVVVTNDRQSAVAAAIESYNPKTKYISATIDNYKKAYEDIMNVISTASDDVFYEKLSDLNKAVAALQLLTPYLSDGSMNYINMFSYSTMGAVGTVNLLDNYSGSFAVYTSAVGLAHYIDFGPNFKVSANNFKLQVRASFPDRISGVAIFGSNDNDTWTRLTPGETTASEDMQTLEVADQYKNEQFRFLKIHMINPPTKFLVDASNMLELSEFRIIGERHEVYNKLSSVSITSDSSSKNRIVLGDIVKLNFTATEPISDVKVNIQGIDAAVQTKDNINWTALANSSIKGTVQFDISYKTKEGIVANTFATTDNSKLYASDDLDLINNITSITNLLDPTTVSPRPSAAVTLSNVNALFDGNISTFSDFRNGTNGSGGYITFDFKAGNEALLSRVEIIARQDQVVRINGVVVQGSNNNSTWKTISNAATGIADWQNLIINSTTPYRYIRIYSSGNWYGNMAELKFHGSIISPLKAALDQAAAIDKGLYTSESLQSLQQEVTVGQALLNSGNATQADIDTAVTNLHTALNGLKYISGMPVLQSLTDKTVKAGEKLTFKVQVVNSGSGVLYGADKLPEGATFNAAEQSFEWTPGTEQGGLYNVTFTATSGGLSSFKIISIKVIGKPVFQPVDTVELTAEQLSSYKFTVSDPAGMPLVYSVSNLPAGAFLNASTGTLIWTPLQSDYGNHLVTITASNESFSVTQQIHFKVKLYLVSPAAYTKASYYVYQKAVAQIETAMNQTGADMVQLASQLLQAEKQLVSIGTLTMTKVAVAQSMVEASTPAYGNGASAAANGWRAFDENTSTFTDTTTNPSWITVTLGEGNAKAIGSVRLYPRSGYEARMNGSIIQGSNNGTIWTDLYTVTGASPSVWRSAIIENNTAFSYLRYYSPSGNSNVAELELYERPIDKTLLNLLLTNAAAVDSSLYTKESIAALETAVTQAKIVLDNANATQVEIDKEDERLKLLLKEISLNMKSNDATLAGITVGGTALPNFAADNTSYNVELPAGTITVPEVVGTVNATGKANAVVTAATALPGTTTILVKAEDGTTTKTYTINFTVAQPAKSTDATLSGITIGGTALEGFEAATTEYNVVLPTGTSTVPTVEGTVTATGKATAVVTAGASLPGTTTIVVTAENGTTKIYKINFTVRSLEPKPEPVPKPEPEPTPVPIATPTPTPGIVINNDTASVVKAIENAADKSTITIGVIDNKLVSKEVFDAIKGTDKTLIFEQNGVQWIFNGKGIKGDTKDVDMTVNVATLANSTAPGRDEIASKVKNTDVVIVSFAENGLLPGKATVRIKMDSAWLSGKDQNNLYVYYYNSTSKKAELVATKLKVDAEGYVEFEITHNSDYFIADNDLVQSGALPKTGSMVDTKVFIVFGVLFIITGVGSVIRRRKAS
jgi:LPXTG-motif cell wall-anchored protein